MGLLRFALAAVLLGSAAAKLASGERGRRALASYGLHGRRAAVAWAGTIALEAVLAVAVAAGVPGAAEAAAVVLGLFTLLLVIAIARGRAGQPCGCFGSRSRIGWGAAARSALLASVAFLFFLRARQAPTRSNLAAWALCSALALLTHYFAVFLIAAEAALLLRERMRDRRTLRAVGAVVADAGVQSEEGHGAPSFSLRYTDFWSVCGA